MGRHTSIAIFQVPPQGAGRAVSGPPMRSTFTLPFLAFAAILALVTVLVADPYSGSSASAAAIAPSRWGNTVDDTQTLANAGNYDVDITRDKYGVTAAPKPKKVEVASTDAAAGSTAAAPAAGTPDPGSAQAIAKKLLADRGWGADQYSCLVSLWNKESGWNVYAANPSGAYGIPQALPGSKMASAGADWQTSAKTQIIWGLGYISGRYSTPCGAWAQSEAAGWY